MVIDFRKFQNRQNFQGVRTCRMSLLITPQPLQHLPAALPFTPFPISIYSIRTKQSAAMVRRRHSNLPQFHPRRAAVNAKLARICAGAGQLISAAGLMRRRVFGRRRAAKNHCPASSGVMPSNFLCVLAKRGFDAALYMIWRQFSADFGLCLNLGAGWGCSGSKCCFR